MLNKLNGWQRMWVVVSLLFLIGLSIYGYQEYPSPKYATFDSYVDRVKVGYLNTNHFKIVQLMPEDLLNLIETDLTFRQKIEVTNIDYGLNWSDKIKDIKEDALRSMCRKKFDIMLERDKVHQKNYVLNLLIIWIGFSFLTYLFGLIIKWIKTGFKN